MTGSHAQLISLCSTATQCIVSHRYKVSAASTLCEVQVVIYCEFISVNSSKFSDYVKCTEHWTVL